MTRRAAKRPEGQEYLVSDGEVSRFDIACERGFVPVTCNGMVLPWAAWASKKHPILFCGFLSFILMTVALVHSGRFRRIITGIIGQGGDGILDRFELQRIIIFLRRAACC